MTAAIAVRIASETGRAVAIRNVIGHRTLGTVTTQSWTRIPTTTVNATEASWTL